MTPFVTEHLPVSSSNEPSFSIDPSAGVAKDWISALAPDTLSSCAPVELGVTFLSSPLVKIDREFFE